MNNCIKRLVKIIIAINVIFCVGCASQNSEYPPPGRKTIEIFGDGRYDICSTKSPFGDYKKYDLYDRKNNKHIEGNILIYKQYERYIYVIGLDGQEGQYEEYEKDILTLKKMPEKIVYTKLDYGNGDLQQSEELSDFSDEDKDIFEKLLNEKTMFE